MDTRQLARFGKNASAILCESDFFLNILHPGKAKPLFISSTAASNNPSKPPP
jgi:hypothetical protein